MTIEMIRPFENTRPRIAESAYVDETALIIGDVHIGADSSVWPMCVARGDINSIRIGERSNIQDGSILHVTHDSEYRPGGLPLVIGDDATIGHSVTLHACVIGNECLIGMGAVVLDGAVIEDRAMVGAGALVSPGKELEGGYLWLGRPAKRARALTAKELEYLPYSARHYVRLQRRHRAGGG